MPIRRSRARDQKREQEGVLYPRAGTLGGCTAHNAMIFMAPHDSDWDGIADADRRPVLVARAAMQRWLRRVEDCRHRPIWRLLALLGIDPTRARLGRLAARSNGSSRSEAFGDRWLTWSMAAGALWRRCTAFRAGVGEPAAARRPPRAIPTTGAPTARKGICYAPLSTASIAASARASGCSTSRQRHPDRLTVELDALATRVLFDGDRAVGVEYLKGRHLYRALRDACADAGERRRVTRAARGDPRRRRLQHAAAADALRHRPARASSRRTASRSASICPASGATCRTATRSASSTGLPQRWKALEGAGFAAGDPLFRKWQHERQAGIYGSNGAALAVTRKSRQSDGDPDLFMMGMLASFKGYYPGYAGSLGATATGSPGAC